jgi:hypothetical protein
VRCRVLLLSLKSCCHAPKGVGVVVEEFIQNLHARDEVGPGTNTLSRNASLEPVSRRDPHGRRRRKNLLNAKTEIKGSDQLPVGRRLIDLHEVSPLKTSTRCALSGGNGSLAVT